MIRTVILEDEPLARNLLRSYLALHEDVELLGEASDGNSGLKLVNETAPDLILLDIQMPGRSGLAVARGMTCEASIVFITAHDAHALAAFELGAFDYLLKPVLPERFNLTLGRIREQKAGHSARQELNERMDSVLHTGYLKRFFVRDRGTLLPVNVPDIVRLESDDDYTAIHVKGKRHLVHLPLRDLAARLDPNHFVRVHRCDIVNLAHVSSGQQHARRIVLHMSDGSQVSSSRAGLQALQDLNHTHSPNLWLLGPKDLP